MYSIFPADGSAIRHRFLSAWGQTMTDADWTQRDDYYWQGPPGWTICRVYVDGMWQYELWFSRGDSGTIYGMRASLAAAQDLYTQKLKA